MSNNRSTWRRLVFGFVLAEVVLGGCGFGGSPNHLRGIVRLDGVPLRSGSVAFFGADGMPHSAPITPEGSYRIDIMDEGDVTIAVYQDPAVPLGFQSTARPDGAAHGRVLDRPDRLTAFPERYMDPARSKLKHRVEKGDHTFDIDLSRP
jgi:hypothetical protein